MFDDEEISLSPISAQPGAPSGPPDVLLRGDAAALRSPGPLAVKSSDWSRQAAGAGEAIELSAEIDGTDASGIAFLISDSQGKFIARLRASYNERVVEEMQRRLRGTIRRDQQGSTLKLKIRY